MTNWFISMKFLLIIALSAAALIGKTVEAEVTLLVDGLPPALSPGRLAFAYQYKEVQKLYVIDFATKSLQELPGTINGDGAPSWSPDGSEIAFHSNASGNYDILVMRSDGTNRRTLAGTDIDEQYPNWSAKLNQIAYQTSKQNEKSKIMAVSPDGSNSSLIYEQQGIIRDLGLPKWSPRGDQILLCVYTGGFGSKLGLFTLATKVYEPLSYGKINYCKIKEAASGTWMPDARGIVFGKYHSNSAELMLVKRNRRGASPKPEKFLDYEGRELDPEWAKLGDFLFFVTDTEKTNGQYEVWTQSIKDKKAWQITKNTGAIRHLSWTPFPQLPNRPKEILEKELENSNETLKGDATN